MSFHQVYTEQDGGGDRVWLGTLAHVSDLQWSTVWPGGPEKASLKFWRDARFDHRAIERGRTVGICVSAEKTFVGELTRPGRGSPWEIEVDGLAVLGNNFTAHAPTSGNPFNCNEVVDDAIDRGLPWVSRPDLPTGGGDKTADPGASERLSVAATLSRVLPESGKTWHVDAYGRVIEDSLASAVPTYLLLTDDPGRGRDEGSSPASALLVVYNDVSGLTQTVWARDGVVEGLRRAHELILDITGRGKMDSVAAQAIGAAHLVLNGARVPWADSFTLARGMVRNAHGTPVDPATVQPPMVARLLLTDPDHIAETNFAAPTDFLVRRVTYYDETDTIDVEPFDMWKTDLKSLLAGTAQ